MIEERRLPRLDPISPLKGCTFIKAKFSWFYLNYSILDLIKFSIFNIQYIFYLINNNRIKVNFLQKKTIALNDNS